MPESTLRSILFDILRQCPELIPAARSAMPSWPWTVFDDEFGGDGFWTLKLEDLTRGDIERYVNDKFHAHTQFRKLVTRDANYSKLVDQVTDRVESTNSKRRLKYQPRVTGIFELRFSCQNVGMGLIGAAHYEFDLLLHIIRRICVGS
ncbi:hypothetical protein VB005_00334 [Metarhizium brunneum]